MFKNDKMVAERLNIKIERARILLIITLVTIMAMLLELYRGILRTLA